MDTINFPNFFKTSLCVDLCWFTWLHKCAILMLIMLLCLFVYSSAACKDHQRALEVTQRSEEMGLILGVCAGGLVVLILLLGAIIIIIKKG